MKTYSEILTKVEYVKKPEPKIVVPRCKPNTHQLKRAGGSSNGRTDCIHAPVYMCLICNQFGYKEDFSK
jgi:hypothetical protein